VFRSCHFILFLSQKNGELKENIISIKDGKYNDQDVLYVKFFDDSEVIIKDQDQLKRQLQKQTK